MMHAKSSCAEIKRGKYGENLAKRRFRLSRVHPLCHRWHRKALEGSHTELGDAKNFEWDWAPNTTETVTLRRKNICHVKSKSSLSALTFCSPCGAYSIRYVPLWAQQEKRPVILPMTACSLSPPSCDKVWRTFSWLTLYLLSHIHALAVWCIRHFLASFSPSLCAKIRCTRLRNCAYAIGRSCRLFLCLSRDFKSKAATGSTRDKTAERRSLCKLFLVCSIVS